MTPPALRTAVKAAAAAADEVAALLRRPTPGVTVLAYHDVGGPVPGEVNLPTGLFRQQMAGLAAAGSVVSLDEAVGLLAPGRTLDRPLVVLTFDDGTAGFVDHALPVLAELGLPVTLYVATAWIEQGRSFWDDGTALSWAALAEAHDSGLVTLGSHSHDHLLFDREPPEVLAADLDRSTGLLADRLGVDAEHFAYPKALAPSPAAEVEVRRRFRTAALAGTRTNHPGVDLHRLDRSPVQVSDGLRWFRRKVAGGMGGEDALRRGLNRLRYRGATT